MASGFFALIDDITALMDDVAITTKIAARKTAGILGDDLAVNAEKATGFMASRELPVLWSITKGSLLNKVIIVPAALLLNAFLPVSITVILILGGFYLAYEGVEKIFHYLFHREKSGHEMLAERSAGDEQAAEKSKIRSAVTTDFILSVEIVIIALGEVTAEQILIQVITVSIVALLATIGVYGLVAILVRLDDIGYRLIKSSNNKGLMTMIGKGLVKALPIIIRILTVAGTAALLLVSGGIFAHKIPYLHHFLPDLITVLREFLFGIAAGLIALGSIWAARKMFSKV
ncbi:DUF808 domain-containing protein [Mucilaginibacter conchicola]|uniref:DUF808 domain-containing protein n=1 Tax=Mucilaginibacter conchicola TaxID=2303333 RepID=A0A372NS17_9SPHI|nr:DUF808 domain-containing protein [Mucilaginibacter conchicola]RFZ91063.1 DUF808 domain-containing protein [Mucilaginibacter conchicola]